MNYPKVSIIILNWNGWKDTLECLESLYQITYPNYDVIIVDNGSEDESIGKIKEYCEGKIEVESKFFAYSSENKPIKIIEYTTEEAQAGGGKEDEIAGLPSNRKVIIVKNEKNYGFPGGNNIGMRYALKVLNPNYILALNNDTLVDKDFLMEMVKVGESDEKIGIIGSKIYYYDYKGRDDVIWGLGGGGVDLKTAKTWQYCMKKIDDNKYNDIIECGYITGCSMLIRNHVLKTLNGFDKNYFFYYEDVDLSISCKKLGYKLVCATKSILWHKVSMTSGGEFSPASMYYGTRNRILFVKKFNNFFNYLLFLIWFLTYKHARRFTNFVILQRKPCLLKYYYKGIWEGILGKYGKGL